MGEKHNFQFYIVFGLVIVSRIICIMNIEYGESSNSDSLNEKTSFESESTNSTIRNLPNLSDKPNEIVYPSISGINIHK